jgi:small subunit ribosomal protein S1
MIHVSEISAEKRINHPQEALKLGQQVTAQVMAVDPEKRQLRLSIKQLVPTGLDEFIAEHKAGDLVTGRMVESAGTESRVELGEGVLATCRIATSPAPKEEPRAAAKADLSSLSSMLKSHWKGGGAAGSASKPEAVRPGQVRSFRIAKLDPASKTIEVELI